KALSQLPAPRNPKIRLYNTKQVLSWEPGSPESPGWDLKDVVYRVQLKYPTSDWRNVTHNYFPGVNCVGLTVTWCNFTGAPAGFSTHLNVSLRVRAELGDVASAWATVPWFQHYRNVTIGPPGNISVYPEEDNFIITCSPPFDVKFNLATFQYYVRYWEVTSQQVRAFFFDASKVPLAEETKMVILFTFVTFAAATRLQPIILVTVGTIFSLSLLSGACLFLVLKYRGLVKYWFHSPPSIPSQIEEVGGQAVPHGPLVTPPAQLWTKPWTRRSQSRMVWFLKDPTESLLEALDRNSSSKDDAWDSVSIVSSPEMAQDIPQAL
ncbi:Interferon gamma receptor 2, partial [Galemys pyrenaicus]